MDRQSCVGQEKASLGRLKSETDRLTELEVFSRLVLDLERPGIRLLADVDEECGSLDDDLDSDELEGGLTGRSVLARQSDVDPADLGDLERCRPEQKVCT